MFQQLYTLNKRSITNNLWSTSTACFYGNATKKNQEVAVGGQRSDGFGVFFRCYGGSLRRWIGWLSETFWLKQVVYAFNVQKIVLNKECTTLNHT